MAVMEYVLVRGELEAADPYPMQGIELQQVADTFQLTRSARLELHPEDYGWERMGGEGIVFAEVVYHPRLLPEKIVVKAPEGGDLKTTFELALALGEQLGANVYNLTTGERVGHNFPGLSAQEQQHKKDKQEDLGQRKGCGLALMALLTGR